MHVETTLNFVERAPAEKPAFYIRGRGPGDRREPPPLGPRDVSIHDARALLAELSLDVHGVELVTQHSALRSFLDGDEVRALYYAEVEKLVREHAGARRVLAFDHNVRSAERAERGEAGIQMPVRFAHNDYTHTSGPQRVRDLLPDEADALLRRRFAVINVWRPTRGPVEATPLAVCDSQSLDESDLLPLDLIYPDREGEIQALRHRPGQRWLYFPRMHADEVILLKCYDSQEDGRARFTAHSAFDDPQTPPDAEVRESIEVRTLAFF